MSPLADQQDIPSATYRVAVLVAFGTAAIVPVRTDSILDDTCVVADGFHIFVVFVSFSCQG